MSGSYDMPDMPKACFPAANVLEAVQRYYTAVPNWWFR